MPKDVKSRRRSDDGAAQDRQVSAVSRDDVERRAYERYCERGGEDGRAMDDWLEAERELSGRAS